MRHATRNIGRQSQYALQHIPPVLLDHADFAGFSAYTSTDLRDGIVKNRQQFFFTIANMRPGRRYTWTYGK
jgi:hypothetical protein